MILSVGSSLSTFKPLRFHAGLNLVLSTRADGSNEGMTRNSAGKTSFVELVHFLLGADCDHNDLFRKKALIDHSFNGTFFISGTEVRVERSGANPSRIFINPEVASCLGLETKPDKASGAASVSNVEWKQFLGHAMFGLPASLKGSVYGESFTPSFRPMFSYFARRDGSGAFTSPERQAERQQRWDWQVNLSYLFGLEWRISRDLNAVRQREACLRSLRRPRRAARWGRSSARRPSFARRWYSPRIRRPASVTGLSASRSWNPTRSCPPRPPQGRPSSRPSPGGRSR